MDERVTKFLEVYEQHCMGDYIHHWDSLMHGLIKVYKPLEDKAEEVAALSKALFQAEHQRELRRWDQDFVELCIAPETFRKPPTPSEMGLNPQGVLTGNNTTLTQPSNIYNDALKYIQDLDRFKEKQKQAELLRQKMITRDFPE